MVWEKIVLLLQELRNRLSPIPVGAAVAYLTSLPTSGDTQHVFSVAAISADCLACLKMSLQNLLDGTICFSAILLQ